MTTTRAVRPREEAITNALQSSLGPMSADELARAAGLTVEVAKKTLRLLERRGRVRRNGSGAWSSSGGTS
ncbi:hypothetical protein ABZ379_10495 [Streptomyces canus]|uniref:DprA-like winged helix domain-containing protein n=1 Tax=Streptomyces canus TaxID=58343 RepID=UPI0033ED7997